VCSDEVSGDKTIFCEMKVITDGMERLVNNLANDTAPQLPLLPSWPKSNQVPSVFCVIVDNWERYSNSYVFYGVYG